MVQFEIVVFWTQPNAANKWRMKTILPAACIADNLATATRWLEEGLACYFTVNVKEDE